MRHSRAVDNALQAFKGLAESEAHQRHHMLSMQVLCDLGYSAMDIITTLFRVVRSFKAEEFLKLEYIKVRCQQLLSTLSCCGTRASIVDLQRKQHGATPCPAWHS